MCDQTPRPLPEGPPHAGAAALAVEAGKTLLENGGEVFRAQQTMEIMARALRIPDFHVYVLTNGIFVSAAGGVHEVRHIPAVSMHLARVEAVNALSRRLAAGELDAEGAAQALAAARALPDHDPRLQFAAGAVGAACFAFLFGAGGDAPLAALAAAAELLVLRGLPRLWPQHRVSRLFLNVAASFAGALTAMLLCLALSRPGTHDIAGISALMLLTPGVALTMAVQDLVGADYLSGTIRLFDALLVAGSLACGVGLSWLCYSALAAALPAGGVLAVGALALPAGAGARALYAAAHFAAAGLATACFAVTFQVPRRHYLACALTGAAGWLAYLLLTAAGMAAPAATLLAALPLAALARLFAARHKAPMTLFLLCGIFPLVPGAGLYRTAYAFLRGDSAAFAAEGGQTLLVAIALALGIALVCGWPLPRRHTA